MRPSISFEESFNKQWSDVESGDPERTKLAVEELRAQVIQALFDHGEWSEDHCLSFIGLAFGTFHSAGADSSHEMLHTLPLTKESVVIVSFDRSVAYSETLLGMAHPRTLWLLEQRADFLCRARGMSGMEGYDLLIARAALDGEGTLPYIAALEAKAVKLSDMDHDDEAALIFEHVLVKRRALQGLNHADTFRAWWWFARTLHWSGQSELVVKELDALVPALKRTLGKDNATTIAALHFHFTALQRLGRESVDETLLERGLAVAEEIVIVETVRYGPNSRELLLARKNVVDALNDMGRNREARLQARSLCEDALTHLGPEDPLVVRLGSMRQHVLLQLRTTLQQGGGGVSLDELESEGVAAVEELCELAVHHVVAAATEASTDMVERVQMLQFVMQYPSRWWDSGTQELVDTLEHWAGKLAGLGETELKDQPGVILAQIDIANRLASELFNAEANERALEWYERVLELELRLSKCESHREVGPSRIAWSEEAVARTLRRVGRAVEAEPRLVAAIRAAEAAHVEDIALAELHMTHALVLKDLDRHLEAAQTLRELWERSEHPRHAVNLSAIYLGDNRPSEAEALLQPVLARLEAAGEGRSQTALKVRGNLALAACYQDRDAEAAVAWDDLITLQSEVMGASHRDTLKTMHNRAREELHLGNNAEAVRRFEGIVQLRSSTLGDRDPDTLSSLYLLALAYEALGDLPRAAATAEKTLKISQEVLGATHPDTLNRSDKLKGILDNGGAHSAASTDFDEELRDMFASSGGTTTDMAALLRYAEHLKEQNRPGDALIAFARARNALSETGGALLLTAERGIAECHQTMGNYHEAAEAFGRCVPFIESLLPDDQWALAEALNSQSFALSKLGKVEEMIPLQRRAVEIADTTGSNLERALWLRVYFARRLAGFQRNQEAHVELQIAQNLVQDRSAELPEGLDSKVVIEIADDTAEVLLAQGKLREAARIYRRNIPHLERVYGKDSSPVQRARANYSKAQQQSARVRRVVGVVALVALLLALVIWNEFF